MESTSIDDGQAPLSVTFKANPSDMGAYTPVFEWHFRKQSEGGGWTDILTRYEEDTQYTFRESGNYIVVLKTHLHSGTDVDELDSVSITVAIAESKLEMPNAFSPNGDGINDIYKAKEGHKSIVEFRAYIFSRWGQKLYEWTDPAGGWDGKYKGKDVAQGVYFVVVKARGADGRRFSIRRDVNLLRGYTETTSSNGGTQEQ